MFASNIGECTKCKCMLVQYDSYRMVCASVQAKAIPKHSGETLDKLQLKWFSTCCLARFFMTILAKLHPL